MAEIGSQLMKLDTSPTHTPFHTRAPSPVHQHYVPHTPRQAQATMNDICEIFRRRESEKVAVSITDGSAMVPATTKMSYLAIYFVFNLGLTLFNKALMIKFPFPFLMTALHALAGFIGTSILLAKGYFSLSQLGGTKHIVLHLFSLLYTINIAVSNLSLSMVTIPFHQVIRATTPIFTILIYLLFFGSTYPRSTYLSLVPVILGVALATYGDYYFTLSGFFWTVLGAFLASVKTVATNRLQTAGLHLNALELLYRMSPLAFAQALIMAYVNGEKRAFMEYLSEANDFGYKAVLVLALNGAIAFGLNVISFTANKKVGALTMTVAGNIKQIITVILAFIFWRLHVEWMNAVGIALTLAGGAVYGYVSLGRKAVIVVKSEGDVELGTGSE